MLQFLFLGQDTGSLFSSYSGILFNAAINFSNELFYPNYVILRDAFGDVILDFPSTGITFLPAPVVDETNYSIVFAGDFFGFGDSGRFTTRFSGDAYGGLKDFYQISYSLAGYPSGILYDRPNYSILVNGIIESGLTDRPTYSTFVNYGQVSGILTDRPVFSFSVAYGQATGILVDAPKYEVDLFGKTDSIRYDKQTVGMLFFDGFISRGALVVNFATGDNMNLSLSFVHGSISR
jgi:hypothetical protein